MQSEGKAEGEEEATIVCACLTRFRKFMTNSNVKRFGLLHVALITVVLFSGGAGVCEPGV